MAGKLENTGKHKGKKKSRVTRLEASPLIRGINMKWFYFSNNCHHSALCKPPASSGLPGGEFINGISVRFHHFPLRLIETGSRCLSLRPVHFKAPAPPGVPSLSSSPPPRPPPPPPTPPHRVARPHPAWLPRVGSSHGFSCLLITTL